jgi:NAD(P)H-dependent FMN reductase
MIRIAVIIGSTRPGRNGEAVGKWVHEIAQKRSDAEFEPFFLRLALLRAGVCGRGRPRSQF